jgi:hypothetical protein
VAVARARTGHSSRQIVMAILMMRSPLTIHSEPGRNSGLAGSFFLVPRGALHTFWNESEMLARGLTVFTPSGIEHSFDAVTAGAFDPRLSEGPDRGKHSGNAGGGAQVGTCLVDRLLGVHPPSGPQPLVERIRVQALVQ